VKADPDNVLRMEGMTKAFHSTLAVDHVDFHVRAGEIHALMGENGAGKSTLMKILAGAFHDYGGRIFIQGREIHLHSPIEAKLHGIGMVFQELSLAHPISIMENILVGRLPRHFGIFLDQKALFREAKRCLEQVGLDLDPSIPVSAISQHEAQLVEIAKVLGNLPCILVLDEPTSALSTQEVKRLFDILLQLKRAGLSIIYISHHLHEVFEIADRVTVLRDGKNMGTWNVKDVTPDHVVQKMVGQSIQDFHTEKKKPGNILLSAKDLTRWGFFHRISFQLRKGEILGVAGLSGAGRTELARSICGLDPLDAGSLLLDGEKLDHASCAAKADKGLLYLTEDRKNNGLFLRLPVSQNLLSTLLARGNRALGKGAVQETLKALDVVCSSSEAEAGTLSGGNQQKVLLGKCLLCKPKVLVLDEPSRGVDIQAKYRIHEAILDLAEKGASVLLLSSDLPELSRLSHRILVMRNGHKTCEMEKGGFQEAEILLAMNREAGP